MSINQIHKLGMGICLCMLFTCIKFEGNRGRISYFAYNKFWKVSEKSNLSPQSPLRGKKMKTIFWKFAGSYLEYALGDLWNVAPLSGGYLHCKLGAIQIRHQRAKFAWKSLLCYSCQYILTLVACILFSWAAWNTTMYLDTVNSLAITF